MYTDTITSYPEQYAAIQASSESIGFSMPSDLQTGALLKALAASKPKARMLEIGTGTGLATAWILSGMDTESALLSIDNESSYQTIAQQWLGKDNRLTLICTDASEWILNNGSDVFDLIFADAWPGKYAYLDETLSLLKPGGIYIIDDMLPQLNWPDGHDKKVDALVSQLEARTDVQLVKMVWSTGIMLVVKK